MCVGNSWANLLDLLELGVALLAAHLLGGGIAGGGGGIAGGKPLDSDGGGGGGRGIFVRRHEFDLAFYHLLQNVLVLTISICNG